jgi:hypothetical protein
MSGAPDSGLFDGVEDSTQEPLSRDDSMTPQSGGFEAMLQGMIREWWQNLTYREWHAFVVGFLPWFLFLVIGHPLLLAGGIGVLLACLGYHRLPNRALRFIVREPWYCLAGAGLGWMLGAITLAWTQLLTVLAGVFG